MQDWEYDAYEEMKQQMDEAKKHGYVQIDGKVVNAQRNFENAFPWIDSGLSAIEEKNDAIMEELEDEAVEATYGDNAMLYYTDGEYIADYKERFDSNVGENGSKLCDEWFSDDQIIDFIEKNYKPAETEWEYTVDEIITRINKLNPETLKYYYSFPERWEDSGLAQKIRDVWKLPTLDEYYELFE
ncbi:MAG: hypothetical protein K6G13_00130 [Agathobacter sp.]|uniref:hypothetical protein n=1 Tax=Agathobacter sp. TaxID=2021311 RepID=UPI0025908CEE|nr:hypothetical protein [Agathobacter sp.]MCR5676426.1 hypothetical protein [Agathobacter sp.]